MKKINLLLSTVAFFVFTQAVAQIRSDAFVPLSGGDSLDASLYFPVTAPPLLGYPAILFVHGFGLSKDADTSNCRVYAAAGYITMCYSVRGHGNSSGRSRIMSSPERSDLAEVVAYLRNLPGVDTSHIGVVGGSQGGLHGLWAAADQLSIQVVSSDVIVPEWATDMLMNGSIRRTVVLLLKNNDVRYDTVRDSLWNYLSADNFDSLSSLFTSSRDVDTVQLNASSIPTLRLLKWQDHYFSAADGIEAFNRYNAPKKMYLGTRGHFSDHVESERIYQYDQVTRWLNHFLRDDNNNILQEPMYTYAYSSLPMDSSGYFTWTRIGVPSWPPDGIENFRFYLASDSALLYTPPAASLDSLYLENVYTDSAYTFDDGFIEGFRGSHFDAKLPKKTFAFESQPFETDVYWIGTPKAKLFLHSDFEKFPLNVQIYEVDSFGIKSFINRINFTGRHWTPGMTFVIDMEGIAHAHKFSQGSRLRIEITNIDVTNRIDLGSYPFVVPMFANTAATVYLDQFRASYIELPLIGSPTSVRTVSELIPEAFSISQNYPNPFNAVTSFEVRVSRFEFVKLKVYDLLGREIATLVNEQLQPGAYRVSWDAGKQASGVYYYRIEAGGAHTTKKMLLLK